MIYPHHLDFMEEAKKEFESNYRLETYRNKAESLIALRDGMDRNCIAIYEISGEVAFFAEIMEKAPELVVDNPTSNRFRTDSPFDVRKEMLARPNEWVGAFKDKLNRWRKIGLDSRNMVAIETRYEVIKPNWNDERCDMAALGELNRCIPIEDVPEEDLL